MFGLRQDARFRAVGSESAGGSELGTSKPRQGLGFRSMDP